MLDSKFHGYYIHGQFPGDSSDVTLEKLKLMLDEEGTGAKRNRGLVDKNPGDADLTTFEVYVPPADR